MNFSTSARSKVGFPVACWTCAYVDKLDQQLVSLSCRWSGTVPTPTGTRTSDRRPAAPHTRGTGCSCTWLSVTTRSPTWRVDVEARTIEASVRRPALAAGRSPDVTPEWGIPAIRRYPFAGSAIVIWDSGSPPPPTTNTPPAAGVDPHEDPRAAPVARVQKAVFLTTGKVIDVCGSGPCRIPHA